MRVSAYEDCQPHDVADSLTIGEIALSIRRLLEHHVASESTSDWSNGVTRNIIRKRMLAVLGVTVLFGACASTTRIEVTQKLEESADAPYKKILIVALFDSFDARRYLEDEIVKAMAERGAVGVASTSMMNTKTPLVRQTFIDMIDEIGADALLLTQLTAHHAETTAKDARPQATYNYWPTYYWNVWQVELTEYVEPPRLESEHQLILATQAFSVAEQEPVWAIESNSKFVEVQEDGLDYRIFVNEANAIVTHLKRDGLIDK